MQLGRVIGHAVSTVKHASMNGWRLLVIQLLTMDGKDDGEPILAFDSLGAGTNHVVIVTNDGAATRQMIKSKTSPARWMVVGVKD